MFWNDKEEREPRSQQLKKKVHASADVHRKSDKHVPVQVLLVPQPPPGLLRRRRRQPGRERAPALRDGRIRRILVSIEREKNLNFYLISD